MGRLREKYRWIHRETLRRAVERALLNILQSFLQEKGVTAVEADRELRNLFPEEPGVGVHLLADIVAWLNLRKIAKGVVEVDICEEVRLVAEAFIKLGK